MSSKPEWEKSVKRMAPLDQYYMQVCPNCAMSGDDCKTGSATEAACILVEIRKILLRTETALKRGKADGA